ncbi:MAG TPA: hypothetical protein VMT11_06450 [Myxococcaceae bacterium]|nr:hypothetical protein [Myxococcaceae bacterium]
MILRSLLAASAVATLGACSNDVRTACIVQRSAGGITYLVELQSAGPSTGACTTGSLPELKADRYRMDKIGADQLTFQMRADSIRPRDDTTRPGTTVDIPTALDPDPAHALFAETAIPATPDADQICALAEVPEIRQDYLLTSEVQANTPKVRSIKLNGLRFLDGADFQGTQFVADSVYTVGDCTRPYTARGLSVTQTCATLEDCDPTPDPATGRFGGINSQYSIVCDQGAGSFGELVTGDPQVGVCFFDKPFPGLK